MEFFKLVGCIVYDYVLPSDEKVDISVIAGEFRDDCDVNIFWNFSEERADEIEEIIGINSNERKIIFAKGKVPKGKMFGYFKGEGIKIFEEKIIDNLWSEDKDNKKILREIAENYVKHKLFFYWYHRGSLKFVQEYYPLDGKDQEIQKKRKDIYIKTFENYKNCYNELLNCEFDIEKDTYYYQYALLNLENELNCLGKLITGGYIFEVKSLIEKAKEVQKKHSEYIRIEFLKANICETESYFVWDAEIYYLNSRKRFKEKYNGGKIGSFFDYRLGKYYEKKQKNYQRAEECYRNACESNPEAYRALYKLAKIEEGKGNYEEAANYANNIIKVVLNGFKNEQLMPRRQIYIYKSFTLLGDVYTKMEYYIPAVKAYERALGISNSCSLYYEDLEKKDCEIDSLKNIIKACMPEQPIYRKIIHGMCKLDDRENTGQYLNRMLMRDKDGNEETE